MARIERDEGILITNGIGTSGSGVGSNGSTKFLISKDRAAALFSRAGWADDSPNECTPAAALQIAQALRFGYSRSASEGETVKWSIHKPDTRFPTKLVLSVTKSRLGTSALDAEPETQLTVYVDKGTGAIKMRPEDKEVRDLIGTWVQSCDTRQVQIALNKVLEKRMSGVKIGRNGKLGHFVGQDQLENVKKMEALVSKLSPDSSCDWLPFSRENKQCQTMIRTGIDRAARERLRDLIVDIRNNSIAIAKENDAIQAGNRKKNRDRDKQVDGMKDKLKKIKKLIKTEIKIMKGDSDGLDSLQGLIDRAEVSLATVSKNETVPSNICDFFAR